MEQNQELWELKYLIKCKLSACNVYFTPKYYNQEFHSMKCRTKYNNDKKQEKEYFCPCCNSQFKLSQAREVKQLNEDNAS